MKFSKNEQINKLVKSLIKGGWYLKKGMKHNKIVSPNGEATTIPGTPSDWRTGMNFAKNIKHIQERGLA